LTVTQVLVWNGEQMTTGKMHKPVVTGLGGA